MFKKCVFVVLLALFVSGCVEDMITGRAVAVPGDKLTIGIQVGPASTLLYVADDMGYFSEEGLDLELVEFTAGKFALQAFLAGSIDLAASGEIPVMYSRLQGNDFYVISQVVEKTINEVRVIAIREEGLTDPVSYFKYKKRKLATSIGGGPEFYTYKFLSKNRIDDVDIVSVKPEDMPAALESGSVDAIAIFDPFAYIAEDKMGDKAVTFKDESLYSELYVLNADKKWVQENPETVRKILRAMVKASTFIEENPEEAKEILMKHSKLDEKTVNGIWDNFVYKPALTRQLVEYLEEEARWARDTGNVREDTVIPDYREIIYDLPLQEVKPENVRL